MSSAEESLRQMHAVLDIFAPIGSRAVPQGQRPPLLPASPDSHVVLVTGTTGSLGTGILAKLLDSAAVRRIFAVNRPSKDGTTLEKRQQAAFEERGYDPMLLESTKLLLVETSITERGLGVDDRLEEDIRNNTTHIIHNAWRVNFNIPLSTYKPILQGMRVLIDFAMGAPKMNRFIFVSSCAILNRLKLSLSVDVRDPNLPIPEGPLHDGSVAIGRGYSESKWVAEQMLYRAAKDCPTFKPFIVRVGVVSGSRNGTWRPTDFVPAIVKSGIHPKMGCLPAYPGYCSWVPLDVAASAMSDFLNATNTENADTAHLVHPQVQPCVNIMRWMGTIVDLPVVPFSEWVGKLKSLASTSGAVDYRSDIPAIKVIPFFEAEGRSNSFPPLILGTDVSLRLSESLRQAEPISMADVASWISYWTKTGFLQPGVAERVRAVHSGQMPSRL